MSTRPGILRFALLAVLTAPGLALFGQDDTAYRAWQEKEQEKFQQFKDKNDRDFYEFLKHEWRGVQLLKGDLRDPIPDPPTLPVYTPSKDQPKPAPAPSPTVTVVPFKEAAPVPVPPPAAAPLPESASIEFYGADLSVSLPASLRIPLKGNPDKESISEYFAAMAAAPYDRVLKSAGEIRAARRLNDWGYTLLLASMGEKLHGPNTNEKVLFTWFMLLKSGFETKVGFSGESVVLLLRVDGRLFAVPFFSFDKGGRYYAVSLEPKSPVEITQLYAYEGDFPGATTPMRFRVPELPLLSNTTATKTLHFTYGRTDYSVPVTYSRDAVRFFEYYPQTEFEVYFDGSISPGAASSLYNAFAPMLKGKSEVEAVNILLRFSQTAFGYKVDKEIFGREKPMFPDEVLYYNDSNCKDRAILFAYLVRTLTRLDVVGLDFPGHISTAVRFTNEIPGDRVQVHGQRYTICDPTFINADAGMCMPQFKGVSPTIIPLRRPSPS